MSEENLHGAQIKAADAKHLLENPILRDAFAAVADRLEEAALKCERTDAEGARAIVISKQLLLGIQREIYRFIETGQLAEAELSRLEKLRQAGNRIFRR